MSTSRPSINSDTLMSYADGTLSAEAAARIERAIEGDQALRDELEDYRRTRQVLVQTIGPLVQDAVPPGLVDLINRTAPGSPGTSNKVVNFPPIRKTRPVWTDALAAGLLLAIGVGAGSIMNSGSAGPADMVVAVSADGMISRASVIAAALETQPSASVFRQDGIAVKPVQTFFSNEMPCREFEVATETAGAVGIACRHPTGWRLETILAASVTQGSGYQVAAGPNDALIEGVLNGLSATPGLERDPEACLLGQHWSSSGANACNIR